MKPSDKSYFNAKFSLVMAFVIQILANQIDNSNVKLFLTIIAFVEVVSAIFELISMVRWQKAEDKAREEVASKIRELQNELEDCIDVANKKLAEAEKEEKAKAKRKTTKKKANNDSGNKKEQD